MTDFYLGQEVFTGHKYGLGRVMLIIERRDLEPFRVRVKTYADGMTRDFDPKNISAKAPDIPQIDLSSTGFSRATLTLVVDTREQAWTATLSGNGSTIHAAVEDVIKQFGALAGPYEPAAHWESKQERGKL